MKKVNENAGFREAFVAAVTDGTANFIDRMVAAAMNTFGKTLSDESTERKVINAVGAQIQQDLKAEGFAAKTVSNRASVARKIARCRTFLPAAIAAVQKDSRFELGARGFDQQTLERILTVSNKQFAEGGKVPAAPFKPLRDAYFAASAPKKTAPKTKALAALKSFMNISTTASDIVDIQTAVLKVLKSKGIEL
jgi:uncharacterized protein (UPF0335 family)